jgi:hypothetical protein
MARGLDEKDIAKVTKQEKGKRLGGRPKGGKNRFNWNAVRQMEDAGFDPIEKMMELYLILHEEIVAVREREGKLTYTSSSLVTSARQILETLAQYGYLKRRPDIEDPEAMDPLSIKLVLVQEQPRVKAEPDPSTEE